MRIYLVFSEASHFMAGTNGNLENVFKSKKSAKDYIAKRKELHKDMEYWIGEWELLK